jgi:hypothetical protein
MQEALPKKKKPKKTREAFKLDKHAQRQTRSLTSAKFVGQLEFLGQTNPGDQTNTSLINT